MEDFSVNDMLEMKRELQEKYKNKQEKISPEAEKHKLLWLIDEISEVIVLRGSNFSTVIGISGMMLQNVSADLIN